MADILYLREQWSIGACKTCYTPLVRYLMQYHVVAVYLYFYYLKKSYFVHEFMCLIVMVCKHYM